MLTDITMNDSGVYKNSALTLLLVAYRPIIMFCRIVAFLHLNIYFVRVFFCFLSGGGSVCTVWFCIVHFFILCNI